MVTARGRSFVICVIVERMGRKVEKRRWRGGFAEIGREEERPALAFAKHSESRTNLNRSPSIRNSFSKVFAERKGKVVGRDSLRELGCCTYHRSLVCSRASIPLEKSVKAFSTGRRVSFAAFSRTMGSLLENPAKYHATSRK